MRSRFRVIARRNNQPGLFCCFRCGEPINDFSDDRTIVHDYVLDRCAAFIAEHRTLCSTRRWREAHR